MRVTLDVFSGRPNPSWVLGPADEKELAKRLARLPRAAPGLSDDGLGYRGFVITNPKEQTDVPAEVRVGHGLVTTRGKTGISTYQDINNIEKWLADQARNQGHEDLLAAVLGPNTGA